MIRAISLLFLFCNVTFLSGQSIDSLIVQKIDSLIKISRTYADKREFENALEVILSAEKISLANFGIESTLYAKCASAHGLILYLLKDLEGAESWYLEANRIREKISERLSLDYAGALVNLGMIYSNMNKFEKAEYKYLEAKSLFEDSLRNNKHPFYFNCMSNLGREYLKYSKLDKAESVFKELIEIRKKESAKNASYALTLSYLAGVYSEMSNYDDAERLYIESIKILENLNSTENVQHLRPMLNLAIMYWTKGEFDRAESLYLKGIDVLKTSGNTESEMYGRYLGDLATLYLDMGDYKNAESMLIEALEIRQKIFGKESSTYAQTLNNLGNLNIGKADFVKAKEFHEEALKIRSKGEGKNSEEYTESLGNLGNLYLEEGDFDKAEQMLIEANQICEKILGKEHPSFANSLFNLADLYFKKGQYANVEPLILNAIRICVKTFGKENLEYCRYINFLADFYRIQGKQELAVPLFLELHNYNRKLVEKCATFSSENQLLSYINVTFDEDICLHSATLAFQIPDLCKASFDDALFYHGYLLDNAQRLVNSISTSDQETQNYFSLWRAYNRRLGIEYARPILERKNVSEMESEAERFEKLLARKLNIFSETHQNFNWHDVKNKLGPNAAAIQFIKFRYYSPKKTDSIMYAALLLHPDWNSPRLVLLFEENQLDSILNRHGERNELYVKKLYSLDSRGARVIENNQRTIYDLLWKPIEKELANIKTIYFSSAGLLHQLNISAIPVNIDTTLADLYNLIGLYSMRQLLIPDTAFLEKTVTDALLFGGIQYEFDSTKLVGNSISLINYNPSSRSLLDFSKTDTLLRVGKWQYLPGTEKEVSSIQKIMLKSGHKVEIFKEIDASEEVFKSLCRTHDQSNKKSPRIIHIATHGFFFPDVKSGEVIKEMVEPPFLNSHNPLIRSGLILAGGNYAWKNGIPYKEGLEDGILTAYEISQMNLSNTELVVLSACETGLGDIQGNEGVYGLQRAFKIAGAKYLIMSLWQVPDKQTSLLMTTFYKKWLELKMTIPDAFHAAQKEMREAGLDPYQWAGFVLVE